MTGNPHRVRRLFVAAALVAVSSVVAAVPPAAARQPKDGPSSPTLTLSTTSLPATGGTVTVSGSDFLVPDHPPGGSVFGGVYVFFGWVRGPGWGPSFRNSSNNDGTFGTTYHYPGDNGGADTRDDGSGVIRLVSFTPGGTSAGETDFHMDTRGNWSTPLVVRGSTYTWTSNVTGRTEMVDCRTVQCGVFTIGAHGKSSRTNELFTPITFTGNPAGMPAPAPGVPNPPAAGGTPAAGGPPGARGPRQASGRGGGATIDGAAVGTGTPDGALPDDPENPAIPIDATDVRAVDAAGGQAAAERLLEAELASESTRGGAALPFVLGGTAVVVIVGITTTLFVRRRRTTG
jgi:hypothetical protein